VRVMGFSRASEPPLSLRAFASNTIRSFREPARFLR
jgi:hypothetical protein